MNHQRRKKDLEENKMYINKPPIIKRLFIIGGFLYTTILLSLLNFYYLPKNCFAIQCGAIFNGESSQVSHFEYVTSQYELPLAS